jgi:molybdopterin molybdotransferase
MKITPFRKLVKPDEAMSIVLGQTAAVEETEEVPLSECTGRVLASDIVSRIDVPPFDRCAMDGYAVRSSDVEGAREHSPVTLKVVGELFAGDAKRIKVTRGTACRVATGAVLPQGADAVIMAEYTGEERLKSGQKEAPIVKILRAEPKMGNVSKQGSDMKKGAVVLTKGTVLDPAKVGVLASVGRERAQVLVKPYLAIFSTGNEIAEPGEKLGPAQVYNSNSFTLASLVRSNGGHVRMLPAAEDTREGLMGAIKQAIHIGVDAIVLSGGSSVGERDLLFGAVSEMGEVLFHGVQIKPGKPFLFGRTGRLLIFGIPGYPASCLTVGYVFLAPAVRKMAGLPATRRTVKAKASRRIASRLGRVQFLAVKVENGEAVPVFKESGAITSLAAADGYIIISDNVEFIEKGEEVEVVLF